MKPNENVISRGTCALAAMMGCYGVNLNGAWSGQPAGVPHLVFTAAYVLAIVLLVQAGKKARSLADLSFALALLTAAAAAYALVCRLGSFGGNVSGFICAIAGIPFYGLTLLVSWDLTYAAAALICLGWLLAARKTK